MKQTFTLSFSPVLKFDPIKLDLSEFPLSASRIFYSAQTQTLTLELTGENIEAQSAAISAAVDKIINPSLLTKVLSFFGVK